MPNQPFVIRLHFYLPGGTGTHGLGSAAHHIDYMGSVEKGELLVAAALASEEHDRSTLESAAIHAKYAGERDGSMGYFGSMADDPHAAQAHIQAAQGPVWRVIASVGESDALAMGGDLTTKEGWERAATPVVATMVQQMGLDPAKVQWIAAAHRHQKNENNPHIHLLMWEQGAPSRKTAQWTDTERRTIRRAWISELYRPERAQLGQEKSGVRTEARATIIDLVARRNDQQGFQRELTERLGTLGQQLPGHGRLAYAFMPSEVKTETEQLIRWLWTTDPGLKAQHDRYLETAERMGTFYWHKDPENTQDTPGRQAALERMRTNAERDLIQRLAGPVLKAARQQAWADARDEYREASTSVRTFLRDAAQAERLEPWIKRLQQDGPADEELIELVQASRGWAERDQWVADWLASDTWSLQADETGRRAWDTVVQSVVQNAARQRQRDELAAAWDAMVHDPVNPAIRDQLWAIAETYAASERNADDWRGAIRAYSATLPSLGAIGGDLTDQRFARHLVHHVQWLDERQAVDDIVTTADLRRARTDPDAVIDRVIRESPILQQAWNTAGYTVEWQQPFTYRYAHEQRDGTWTMTEQTFRERGGPLLQASPVEQGDAPFALIFPSPKPPPGIHASLLDRTAQQQAVDEAHAALRERVGHQITSIGYARGVYRHPRVPDLIGVLHRLMAQAERDARLTAYWLSEAQWQRKKAEAAIAQNTGQDLTL